LVDLQEETKSDHLIVGGTFGRDIDNIDNMNEIIEDLKADYDVEELPADFVAYQQHWGDEMKVDGLMCDNGLQRTGVSLYCNGPSRKSHGTEVVHFPFKAFNHHPLLFSLEIKAEGAEADVNTEAGDNDGAGVADVAGVSDEPRIIVEDNEEGQRDEDDEDEDEGDEAGGDEDGDEDDEEGDGDRDGEEGDEDDGDDDLANLLGNLRVGKKSENP